MNAYHLPYLSLFRGCIILRCVCFFLIFSLNYQQGVTRCCIHIDKWEEITKSSLQTSQKQSYGYIWIWQKFTVWKGDFSLYHFLSSFSKSKYSDSSANFCRHWRWVWFDMTYIRLVFCLPDLHACVLVYEIKTNASHLLPYLSTILEN